MRNIKIIGVGKYLPKKVVTSEEVDRLLGLKSGWAEKKSGVKTRHYANGEIASEMAVKAIQQALKHAGLTIDDIDCIVSTSGTMEQAIPCGGSLIHERLKPKKPIPAFDVNSTCLSFVTGLDLISHAVHLHTYKRVVIVSSDIASIGINPKQKESYVLFGDASAACIIERTNENESSKIISSKMETYSEGARLTEIRGAGTRVHPNYCTNKEDNLFDMDGKEVFRLSSKVINEFVDDLLGKGNLTMKDMDLVVPHQASEMAMRIMRGKLGIEEEKFINVIEKYGNTIAASIPLALHDAIESGKLKRGQKAMLIGTSAGLSVGGIVLEY